jgi:hypothetical protein
LVLVLVCMACVTILGAAVLYLSYTGMRVKVAERQSKEDFYDASAAMDEIRAGLQEAVSDAITAAYKTTLINYNNPDFISGMTLPDRFQEEVHADLTSWQTGGTALFIDNKYSLEALRTFVRHTGVTVDSAADLPLASYAGKVLTLKAVRVTYTDPRSGYSTSVTSDLTVRMPDFSYLYSEYSISGLPEFAVITQTGLEQATNISTLTISGSAYAGAIDLRGSGSSLTINGGTMVCAGDVSVTDAGPSGGPRLTVDDTVDLWANHITVNTNGSVQLSGTTHVRDDLDLAGLHAGAVLQGSYYGFGSDLADAGRSSAILVNGRQTSLDLSGLNRLMLAGHSFISNYKSLLPGSSAQDVLMGESLSVRSNQEAYLLSREDLPTGVTTNPYIHSTSETPAPVSAQTAAVLLNDYGAAARLVSTPLPGTAQAVTYYFLTFSDPEKANQYFKAYFDTHQAEIASYLNSYTTLSAMTGKPLSVGYTLGKKSDGSYALQSYISPDFVANSAAKMLEQFGQLTTTLFETGQSVPAGTNPYTYFVRQEMLGKLPDAGVPAEFLDSDGSAVALMVRNTEPYSVNFPADSKMRVIIATGDVTVNQNFNGLIICGGKLTMDASVNADREDVTAAFASGCTLDGTDYQLSDFLRAGVANTAGESAGAAGAGWKLDELVGYQNWSKN